MSCVFYYTRFRKQVHNINFWCHFSDANWILQVFNCKMILHIYVLFDITLYLNSFQLRFLYKYACISFYTSIMWAISVTKNVYRHFCNQKTLLIQHHSISFFQLVRDSISSKIHKFYSSYLEFNKMINYQFWSLVK